MHFRSYCTAVEVRENGDLATTALEKLAANCTRTQDSHSRVLYSVVPQLGVLEGDVTQSISDLQTRNYIFGTPPGLNEFLESKEEAETRDPAAADVFDGPGGDKAIVGSRDGRKERRH